MDDKVNEDKNQSPSLASGTIFSKSDNPENIQPEEVSPDIANPEDVLANVPPDLPPEVPPVYEENRSKYVIIAIAAIFFVVVVVLVIQFLLPRRSGELIPNGQANQPVTLIYWGLWEDKEIFEPIINDYQTKHPNIKINYEKQSPQQYREKIIARQEKGPDIFRFHNTWIPEIKEIVSPIPNSIMTNEEFQKTYYPIIQKDLKIENQYYGIPLYIDGLVLIYNDSLFKQVGLVQPPVEWISSNQSGNDVIYAVGKLSTPASAGIALGTTTNIEHFSEIYGLLLLLNGGDLKKLDSEAGIGALQLYRKFAEENIWTNAMPNSVAAFIQGKVAMIIAPSWQVLSIKKQNPELSVKIAPIPKGLNGKSVSLADYWVEGVSKYSKNQLEAWQFLKYLAEKETQLKLFEIQSKTRLFGTAYARVDLADKLASNEYLRPVISQANSYLSLPVVSRTYDNGLNDAIVQYIRNAINASSEGVDYKAALETATIGINQILNQYNIE